MVFFATLGANAEQPASATEILDSQKEAAEGKAAAAQDIAKGEIRYEVRGEPSQIDAELLRRAKSEYNIAVVFTGCTGGPRIHYDQSYHASIVEYLTSKYGFDPIDRIQAELMKQ